MMTGKILEKIQSNRKWILLHLFLWLLPFLVNILFIANYRIDLDFSYHTLVWLIYCIVFYLNYFLLMPFLFFHKHFAFYLISSVIMLASFQLVKIELDQYHFRKTAKFEENIKPPDQFFHNNRQPPSADENWLQPPDNKHKPPEEGMHKGFRLPPFTFYGIFVFYFASISFRFFQKWQDDEKRNREIEKEKVSTELSFLKQQINPHFLFNALNSIYSMTINTSKPASDAILKLSSILRYMLYETENKMVNLTEEILIITDYIDLQKIRLPGNVSVSYNFKGESKNYKIAPLLLIPLIENAFKHGVNNVKKSFIEIMIKVHNGELELHTRNSVLSVNKQEESSGIGIKNIKRRLDLLYPGNYLLDIDESDNIFKLTLKIKLEE